MLAGVFNDDVVRLDHRLTYLKETPDSVRLVILTPQKPPPT